MFSEKKGDWREIEVLISLKKVNREYFLPYERREWLGSEIIRQYIYSAVLSRVTVFQAH